MEKEPAKDGYFGEKRDGGGRRKEGTTLQRGVVALLRHCNSLRSYDFPTRAEAHTSASIASGHRQTLRPVPAQHQILPTIRPHRTAAPASEEEEEAKTGAPPPLMA